MAGNSLSPNLDHEHRDALRAAIQVVTRRLKEQGVKTSLIARSKIVELAIEHLRSAASPNGRGCAKLSSDAQTEGH
jgi:hypothetical protein